MAEEYRRPYGSQPIVRTVHGLKPHRSEVHDFAHNRVETHDYGGRPYVYCTVEMGGNSFYTVFGWLHDREAALLTDEVRVITMTRTERRTLGRHIASVRSLTAASISFW